MENNNKAIGERIRSLRLARRLPQRQLATTLGVSQASISRIESGKEGLTVDQLIKVCRLFNVPPSEFFPEEGTAQTQIRRSLIRHGAKNLADDDRTLPSERFVDAKESIKETLIAAESPRDIAALAPVLAQNAGQLSFGELERELAVFDLHFHRRFCWLLDNTLSAIHAELESPLPRPWRVLYLRARTRLQAQLKSSKQRWTDFFGKTTTHEDDVLDVDLLSEPAIDEARLGNSDISNHWNIVSRLQVEDFAKALREARQ